MKLFTALQTQWNEFQSQVNKYIIDKLGLSGGYGPSNIFGQIFTVLNGAIQNVMLYIEDALTEQNVYTAERKKSIYSLARLTGYEPGLGTASKCSIRLTYKPTSGLDYANIMLPNRTRIQSNQNGLVYNIILPSDIYVFNPKECSDKYINAVEGTFESRDYTSTGGELYSINYSYTGDIDIDYVTVRVNGEKYERVASLYDMLPDGEQYVITTSLSKGIDIVFGNGQFGHVLEDGDNINVEVLVHNGEVGNIKADEDSTFKFVTSLSSVQGDSVDGNDIFTVELENREGITSGTYSEATSQVRNMIGYNSRSLVLADAKNYKILLNKYSFVGYNRCWSESGSLVVNALILKNYKNLMSSGSDYFSLDDKDFLLSDAQKESLRSAVVDSQQQIAGTILNFIEPELKKYALIIYLKMKDDVVYDAELIRSKIRNLIGTFFSELGSDIYIPKSDIIKAVKDGISEVDGINIYILSEDNELAKINGYYTEYKYIYNPSTMNYDVSSRKISVGSTDPHVGLDDHGNILLENDMFVPILRAGWNYKIPSSGDIYEIQDPVQIIFQK